MSHSPTMETQVKHLLTQHGIDITAQLKPPSSAALFGLSVESVPAASIQIGSTIYLDNRVSEAEQFEQFALLLHNALITQSNDLLHAPPTEERERFALHYCMPTHMLTSDSVEHLVDRFNVTPAFAAKRLNL